MLLSNMWYRINKTLSVSHFWATLYRPTALIVKKITTVMYRIVVDL